MSSLPLHGLVAATHTPFHADGSLNLGIIEPQAAHLIKKGVAAAFIGGTTGESSSLTLTERQALATRWAEVVRGTSLRLVVHVGANCVEDSCTLAAQAQELGAEAVAALAPSYFKPGNAHLLVETMAAIAAACPALPFYYYEIPTMTGLQISPSEFLAKAADRIPNLAGIKFTSNNLMEYQLCRTFREQKFDIPYGFDEIMLSALALGAKGAVGSSFNFAAPIYLRVMAAFAKGDFDTARVEQMRSVRTIQTLVKYGYMGAAKATMKMLGVDVGPARLPNGTLSEAQAAQLQQELTELGFFEWVA